MSDLFAGRFEILDPIADGGMGSVWTAKDHKHGTMVAVKLLRQADAGSLMRFMREQGTRIEHDHIITPISWAGEDDKVLFSMPLVTGGSVATILGDYGRLTPAFTAEIMRQTLSALHAVHSAGVVHRDIKPGNLLLDPTGTGKPNVWLTDFGVATPVDAPRLTQVAHVIGTPGYLAPELMQFADPAPSQDLYALGMMAGQMLTGERPAMNDPVDRYTKPDDCPQALWDVVRALAAPRVEDRPASAEAALRMLSVPELAWPARGQDEIEVFQQVEMRPGMETDRTDPVRIVSPVGGTYVATPASEQPTALTVPQPPREAPRTQGVDSHGVQAQHAAGAAPVRRRRGGVLGPALAAFLGALLLGLAVVMAWHPWKDTGDAGSGDFEPMPAASHAADAPGVGDACEWNLVGTQVGSKEDTMVRCTMTKDGYRWLQVPWEKGTEGK